MSVSLPQVQTGPLFQRLDHLLDRSLEAGVYLIGALLLSLVIARLFKAIDRYSTRLIKARGGAEGSEISKQTSTISLIARRSIIGVIWALALLAVLNVFGFDIRPILATAGVAGIAVGFAAQSLLKDFINGFFLLAEGHIRINDVVTINGLSGVVEELTLRTTVLRATDGAVHVISNGSISQLSNLTQLYSYALFDLSVDHEEDPDVVVAKLRSVAAELRSDPMYAPMILETIDVMGVDRFTEQGIIIKARIKTTAGQQWKVGRELNRRLLKSGFQFATAQRIVQKNLDA